MAIRLLRRLSLGALGLVFLSGSNCGSNGDPHPPLSTPTATIANTGSPNGGPSAAAASMNVSATDLANLIIDYREQVGLPPITANNILTGVAQTQANDMAAHGYVGLVASDGEDALQRLANSGYANEMAGTIAVGYSTDAHAVFNDLLTNSSSVGILLNNGSGFTSIGVGYSNGYWMVILGSGGATTTSGSGPPALTATLVNGQVNLAWTSVTGATSYSVYRGTASGSETFYSSVTGTFTTDSTATDGTTYYYYVEVSGTSSQSNEVWPTPIAAPTSSLGAVTATSITISWPAVSGAISYSIYRGTASGSETPYVSGVTATTYTDTNVTPGTTYYYTVYAVNANGMSASSTEISATLTIITVSTTTTINAPTVSTSTALVTVTVSAVTGTVTPTGSVTLSWSSGSATEALSSGSATFTLTGLVGGTYTLSASYSPGVGFNASTATDTLVVNMAPAPPTLSLAGVAAASMSLSWTAVAGTASYNIYKGTASGSETFLAATGTNLTYNDTTGITDDTTYYYTVAAVGSWGTGTQSNEVFGTPMAALTLTVAATTSSSVTLTWASTSTLANVTFTVSRGPTSGSETPIASTLTTTSYTDSSVTTGSTYYYTVSAVASSVNGMSGQSNQVKVTPLPSPTLSLVASSGIVTLTWTPVTGATSYSLYRGAASGSESLYTANIMPTTYKDVGVVDGTTYYYYVVAIGTASNPSNQLVATPVDPPSGVSAANGPPPIITWNSVAGATSYNIYRGTVSGGETLYAPGITGNSYTDSSAMTGTTYYYKVTAANSTAESIKSSEVSATP